jgi:hypothetical protein
MRDNCQDLLIHLPLVSPHPNRHNGNNIMIELATDFVVGVFRDYFGLQFEIVEPSNMRLHNSAFLTSGSTRLMLRLSKVESVAESLPDSSFRASLFGDLFHVHYRIFEDNVCRISLNEIGEAVEFAQSQSILVDSIDCSNNVQQLGFELPDVELMENAECAGLISQRLKSAFVQIPHYCGRMLDGEVSRSDDDARGRARYVQFSLYRPMLRDQVASALKGLVHISTDWTRGQVSTSEVAIEGKPGKALLLSRRF